MIKAGVDLRGLAPQMAIAYSIAQAIYAKHGSLEQCVITSGRDGEHKPKSGKPSLHYVGKALDLRSNTLAPATAIMIASDLKQALGTQFDVVLEKDHIHVEFDPKEDNNGGVVI